MNNNRHVLVGAIGTTGLLGFYLVVLTLAGSFGHALEQFASMWHWIFLLAAGFQLVFQIPMSVAVVAAPGNIFVMTIGEILNIAASCLATAFTAIAMILFYYDIRLRKEGFDLRMMAENL